MASMHQGKLDLILGKKVFMERLALEMASQGSNGITIPEDI